jgi:hypothetical protein
VVAHEISSNVAKSYVSYIWVEEPPSFLRPFILNYLSMFDNQLNAIDNFP